MDLTQIYASEKSYKYNLTLLSSWAAIQTKLSAIAFYPTTPWKLPSKRIHGDPNGTSVPLFYPTAPECWCQGQLTLPKTLPFLSAVTLLPAFPSSRATAALMDAYPAASLWAWSLALTSPHFSLLSLSGLICSHIQVRPIFISPDPASPWTSDSAFSCYWSPPHCNPPNIFKVDVFKIHHPYAFFPNLCFLPLAPHWWIPCHHLLGPLILMKH